MAQGRHGGDVAQHAQEVQLPLLGQRRAQLGTKAAPGPPRLTRFGVVGGGPRRLAHLLLDVPQELLDTPRPGHRLRALDADDRALCLLVDEVQVGDARCHQHPADEHEEDDDVLPEQPAPRHRAPQRRNASARRRIFRGTVRPSCSAVLRFTARSILLAPTTGNSAGRDAAQDLDDELGGLETLRVVVGAVGHEPTVAHPERGVEHRGQPQGERVLDDRDGQLGV
jgi:hypothetical protein